VALCPCDGTLDAAAYQTVVDRLLHGIEFQPDLLLEPLAGKMSDFSDAQRYEEAASVRDRHDALARAIQRRQAWVALQGLGTWLAETDDGSSVAVDHGRLSSTWKPGEGTPLVGLDPAISLESEVPPSVEAAEEAHILWHWLENSHLRIVETTGSFDQPAQPARTFQVARRS
jgi:DNA polymerase-3 subunit epsilon